MKQQYPSHSTARRIAHHLTVAKCAHGIPKPRGPSTESQMIHSVGTERTYKAAIELFLNWRAELGLNMSGPYSSDDMQEFLYECSEIYEQKQINTIRQALQVVFDVSLQNVESERSTDLVTRAYQAEELQMVLRHQCPRNQLATQLCHAAGLRAHELFSIVRHEGNNKPSSHRQWRSDLHTHREPLKEYIVTGKGGLKRSVGLPIALAAELELTIRSSPVTVVDREIKYEKCWYDVSGGQALSQSFTDASKKALGWSCGLHGLRHSFAQRRLRELRDAGVATDDALRIVSEELGHFRPSITLVYLR